MEKMSFGTRVSLALATLTNRLSEKQSSDLAQALSFGLVPAYGSSYSRRGAKETLMAFEQSPWLRSVENRIMQTISTTEWQIIATKSDGKFYRDKSLQRAGGQLREKMLKRREKQGIIKKIEKHPMYDVIYNFPGNGITITLVSMVQMYLDLVGEAFLLKERDENGVLRALWPVPPNWITALPTSGDPYFEVQTGREVGKIPYDAMVWIRHPSPTDPYLRGTGVAMTLADELDTDDAAAKYIKGWFLQGAMPPVIISAAGPPGNADTTRLERVWIQKTQGVLKRHIPFFLNRSVDVHQLSHTFKDMEVNQLRKFERDVITQTYGVPPEIIGVIENSNRSTIDAADYLFTTKTIIPRLELLRYAFQIVLEEEFDEKLVLTYESPVFEDKEFILKVARSMPASRTIDEWREWQGLDPLKDGRGDAIVMTSGFAWVPVEQLGGEIVYTTPQKDADSSGPEKSLDDEDDDDSFHPGGSMNKAPPEFGDTPPAASERTLPERVLMRLDEKYGEVIASLIIASILDAQEKLDVHRVAFLLSNDDYDGVMLEIEQALGDMNISKVMSEIRNAMAEAGSEYARDIAARFGVYIPFNVDSREVMTWIFDHSEELEDQLVSSTKNGVSSAISSIENDELSYYSVAILIGTMFGLTADEFGTLKKYLIELEKNGATEAELRKSASEKSRELLEERGKKISENELALANGWALEFSMLGAASAGIFSQMEYTRVWVVTWDDRTCPNCLAMSGETSPVGGMWATPLGPVRVPNEIHPGCRCTYVLIKRGG